MTTCGEIPLVTEKLWHVLMQNGRCVICGEPIFLAVKTHRVGAFSFEHKIPRSHGGNNSRANIAGSHNECNKARGNGTRLRSLRPLVHAYPRPKQPSYKALIRESRGIWWTP